MRTGTEPPLAVTGWPSPGGERRPGEGCARLLTVLAYHDGPIDGLAGPKTRSAITTFQQRQGQPATGVVTPGLLDQLRVCVGAYQRCVA